MGQTGIPLVPLVPHGPGHTRLASAATTLGGDDYARDFSNHNMNPEEGRLAFAGVERLKSDQSVESIPEPAAPHASHRHSIAFIADPRTAQVRRNWMQHVVTNFKLISRSSKLMLITVCFMMATEIVSGTSVLVLANANGEVCDRSLDMYLVIHVLRVSLIFPLIIYQYLHPPIDDESLLEHELPDPVSSSTHETTNTTPPFSLSSLRLRRQEYLQQRHFHINNELSQLIDRLKSGLDMFGVLWFIVGNWFIFSSTGCARTAPMMYYMTLMFLGIGYVIVCVPVMICGGIVFCLPCMLVWMKAFSVSRGNGDGVEMSKVVASLGASDDVIRRFPVLTFRKRNVDKAGMEKKRNSGYSDPLLLAFPVLGGISSQAGGSSSTGCGVENRKFGRNNAWMYSSSGNLLVDVNDTDTLVDPMVDMYVNFAFTNAYLSI
ncbi:hypothetical protein HDU98_003764 [Podochytrium sp. JEL0797]|nr:hypothetical protein HDU98_003764 [Podochytrium sp. JEL0797]